ncbi:MAG TPA: M15 family metallopeptidase [Sphingobacteriaceae bacterium]
MNVRLLFIVLLSASFNHVYSQSNPYGLTVINSLKEYKEHVAVDSNNALVPLNGAIPGVVYDIRYATGNNFMLEPMYDRPAAYLRLPAARALRSVQEELREQGLGLKIYDGYRPYAVTVAFYEKVKDSVFVASPRRGSRHNRGCAVDLTIIDLKTGKELLMPTPYDDFTKKAHTDYAGVSAEAIRNRELLKKLMVKYGFQIYADEWWHYDFKDWNKFPLMDIPFEQLEALN